MVVVVVVLFARAAASATAARPRFKGNERAANMGCDCSGERLGRSLQHDGTIYKTVVTKCATSLVQVS